MADYAIPGEKFVEIPGVVEIRWILKMGWDGIGNFLSFK